MWDTGGLKGDTHTVYLERFIGNRLVLIFQNEIRGGRVVDDFGLGDFADVWL